MNSKGSNFFFEDIQKFILHVDVRDIMFLEIQSIPES